MPRTMYIKPAAVGVLAVALLASLVSADPSSAGELPLPQDRVVYSCGFDFIQNICSMNPDGTDEVQLTDDGPNDYDPEVSPSGQEIAWTRSSSEIWLMNADGSNQRMLTNFAEPAFAPTWSPTGTQLAFGCWDPASIDQGICIANRDGSGVELVYALEGATQPDWAPGGGFIAFESSTGQTDFDIYVLNLSTHQAINITDTKGLGEHGARWSPNGTQLAFFAEDVPVSNNIYVMDANGANRRMVFSPAFGAAFSSPTWSPDGSLLAFLCDESSSRDREMCVADVESGDLVDDVELAPTHDDESWSEPHWGSTGGTQQGDVDCNGSADTVDYLKILRFVAGLGVTHASPCPDIGDDIGGDAPALWGDLDCNGSIDSVDALKGLRFVAALAVTQNEPCWDLGSIVVPA